jgi:hypothetical protein
VSAFARSTPIMAACEGAEYGSMMVLTTRSLQINRLKSAST